ncbi:hypothetical protein A1D15_3224 [Lactiplantibacillus plantarum]|nr:hypothetical protein A1D15_3224 [Lactiplantibacillus plantarum]WCL70044.1 hypothetical protein MWLp12_2693 [Lactiplantibacillus plantarum]
MIFILIGTLNEFLFSFNMNSLTDFDLLSKMIGRYTIH